MDSNPKLIANRRRAARKANVALVAAIVALGVPALLLAGADLSGVLYPAQAEDPAGAPGGQGPPVPVVSLGSAVSLEVVGTLDNGTVFMEGHTFEVTVGDGQLVPGLEAGLMDLSAGDTFDITVSPADGYGVYDSDRVSTRSINVTRNRDYREETEDYTEKYGTLTAGKVIDTRRWPSVVTNVTGKYVYLEYQPTVGETVNLYRYYNSTVVGFNDTKIFLRNEVYVGLAYTRFDGDTGKVTTYRVTSVTPSKFTLDSNPPLAGQTLHFAGKLIEVQPGTGAAPPPSGPVGATAVPVGADNCKRCHGGFAAMDALVSATKSNGTLVVDVTVENPWNHDLKAGTVSASVATASGQSSQASEALPNLAPGEASGSRFELSPPQGNSTLEVVVDATAAHTHTSGGKPNSIPYQLKVQVPISGEPSTEAVVVGDSVAPFERGTIEDPWALVGRAFGFVSLGLCAIAAFQGGKRHVRLPPWFKVPPWVTTHFLVALAAILMSVGHGVILMSGMYRGLWSLDIVVGVVGLALLGWLGFSGIFLAKWMKTKVPWVRKLHFWLMSTMVGAGVVHVVVSSTTLHDLIGY